MNILMHVWEALRVPILAGVAAALLTYFFASPAKSHDWYDKECCDVRDCKPLLPEQVKVVPEGYITPDGELIRHNETRISLDQDYHWCKYQPDSTKVIQPYTKKKCFYIPQPTF
jgi:hypothetical protein